MIKSKIATVRLGLPLIIAVLTVQVCFAQSEPESILFDQTENGYCSEDLVARMDAFLSALSKSSSSKGLIIFKGKHSDEGKNLTYYQILESHAKQRGFDPARISFVRAANGGKNDHALLDRTGASREEPQMELWFVQKGQPPPSFSSK